MKAITYKEFAKDLNNLGYIVEKKGLINKALLVLSKELGLLTSGNIVIARISMNEEYSFSMYNFFDANMDYDDWKSLLEYVLDLSATPIKERGEV